MDTFLKLKNLKPLAQGSFRWVFQHPEDPDLLVKVIHADAMAKRFGKKTRWYKRPRRYGKYLCFAREIQEFITVHAQTNTAAPFLQRIIGFAQTDLGLGIIVQAIRNSDGNLAPTLRNLINNGLYDAAIKKSLDDFLALLLESDVIINDLSPGNIVYTHNEKLGNHFVMIDGLGNNSFIPFKNMSKTINRRSKLKRFQAFFERVEHFKKRSNHYPT